MELREHLHLRDDELRQHGLAAPAALLGEAGKPRNTSRVLDGRPVRGSQFPLPSALGDQVDPADLPHLELTPAFHLHIVREETETKVVRLLLQALKIPDTGDWVVARPVAIYGEHRISLGGIPGPREHRLETPQGPLVIRRDIAAEMNAILSLQQAGLASLAGHSQFRFLARGSRQPRARPACGFRIRVMGRSPRSGHGCVPPVDPSSKATAGP